MLRLSYYHVLLTVQENPQIKFTPFEILTVWDNLKRMFV